MNLAQDDEAEARTELQSAVGDSFEIRERIGRGGYADVFCAFDPRLKRTVAIKVLRRDLHATPELIERFRREAESIATLRHPNLLPIHDIGEHDGTLYLVLEHIRGESLEHYIRREQQAPIDEAVRIIREVAGALAAAHGAGLVHRDIKPSNIMLEGTERRALLMDFGLAGALGDEQEETASGMFVGTPHYLSPEQAAGDSADHRADLYALGVVGYELLAGRPPFEASSTAEVLMQHLTRVPVDLRRARDDCPSHVATAVERCLAKSPRERWQTAEALVVALASPAVEAVEVPQPGTSDQRARRRAFRGAVALGLLIPAAGLAIETALGNPLSWSLVLLAAAPIVVVLRYARLWREGETLAGLWHDNTQMRADPEEEEFGRHSALVREARRDRAHIVRALAAMTRLENELLRRCVPAADALIARCIQHARRLRSLDQQISAARTRPQTRSHKLLSELLATREHTTTLMVMVTEQLAELRDLVERTQGNAGETALELQGLLAESERAASENL